MKRSRGRALDGLLLLDKPPGISSNQALQHARRIFDARKAGHTGNLDVLASGLLPVCFGEATKFSAYLLDACKRYEADVVLGYFSTTGDAEGERRVGGPVPRLTTVEIRSLLREFEGEIEQIPPMYSALKHHGQPLYRLARQGTEIPRVARRVTIYALELLTFESTRMRLRVECSKGTYIRTLAEDIGKRLGCGAYLGALRRLSVGPFSIDDALSLEELQTRCARGIGQLHASLLPVDGAVKHMPGVALTAENAARVRLGQPVALADVPRSALVRIYDPDNTFMGVGQVTEGGRVTPRRLTHVEPRQ